MVSLHATNHLDRGANPWREEEHPQNPANAMDRHWSLGKNSLRWATGSQKGKGVCFQGRRDEVRSKTSVGLEITNLHISSPKWSCSSRSGCQRQHEDLSAAPALLLARSPHSPCGDKGWSQGGSQQPRPPLPQVVCSVSGLSL